MKGEIGMKVKIKNTGEIVNVVEYAKITLEQCDSRGNPIEMKLEDVELIEDINKEDEHWQDVRERAAIATMQGLLSNSRRIFVCCQDCAEIAINYADTLVKELKKK